MKTEMFEVIQLKLVTVDNIHEHFTVQMQRVKMYELTFYSEGPGLKVFPFLIFQSFYPPPSSLSNFTSPQG